MTENLKLIGTVASAVSAIWLSALFLNSIATKDDIEKQAVQHDVDLIRRDKVPVQQQIWAIEARNPTNELSERERMDYLAAQKMLDELEDQEARKKDKLESYK